VARLHLENGRSVDGGDVHELGVMLLVLLPVPYVEVSASAGFRGEWTRCAVGAAGIMVELFIAALALFTWLLVEPGLVRALAFNVMLTRQRVVAVVQRQSAAAL